MPVQFKVKGRLNSPTNKVYRSPLILILPGKKAIRFGQHEIKLVVEFLRLVPCIDDMFLDYEYWKDQLTSGCGLKSGFIIEGKKTTKSGRAENASSYTFYNTLSEREYCGGRCSISSKCDGHLAPDTRNLRCACC